MTTEILRKAGLVKMAKDGVRLLATGTLKTKLSFKVEGVSEAAKAAVEKIGGKVDVTEAA